MPLTRERDGIVHVLVYGKPEWYIVDPQARGGFDPAVKALLSSLKPTYRSEWQFIARVTVFLVVWLLVGGGIAYFSNTLPALNGWRGWVYLAAVVVGGLAAWAAIIPVYPLRSPSPRQLDTFRVVPHQIAKWADDSIAADHLWSLVVASHRLEEVRKLAIVVLEDWLFEHGGDLKDDAAHTLVMKTLKREFAERRADYVRLGEELGFRPSGAELSDLTDLEMWISSED